MSYASVPSCTNVEIKNMLPAAKSAASHIFFISNYLKDGTLGMEGQKNIRTASGEKVGNSPSDICFMGKRINADKKQGLLSYYD